MVDIACRDCGQMGSESPDDPAPGLCPRCYKARMDSITPRFIEMARGPFGHPFLLVAWLEEALIDIGGELPEYAQQHASKLGAALLNELNPSPPRPQGQTP